MIVKRYKEEYLKKHKNNNAYTGSRETSNLNRWFKQKWVALEGKSTYLEQENIFHPYIRKDVNTPITLRQFSKQQIEKAIKEKKTKGRVKSAKL